MGEAMNIYVGKISPSTTEEELQKAFEAFGEVSSVNIIKDKFTGVSREFGFIEMPTKAEADAAIAGLNGTELGGRTILVNEARPRSDTRRGGGGGGREGNRGEGGGGYRGGRGRP
jgi:RNA recognition motif-containing protein